LNWCKAGERSGRRGGECGEWRSWGGCGNVVWEEGRLEEEEVRWCGGGGGGCVWMMVMSREKMSSR